MTFGKHNQPNHDRAEAARKAESPWRKKRTVDERTMRLHAILRAAERQKGRSK